MRIVETTDGKKIIPISEFDICLEDNVLKKTISKLYTIHDFTWKCCYFLHKFERYLKDHHNISLKDYCKKHLEEDWPSCPVLKEEVGYRISGAGICFSTFKQYATKEFSEKFRSYCDRISEERKGSGNPMYNKKSWNTGLDKTDPRVNAVAEKRRGQKMSDESREKMREARFKSEKKIRHCTPHSEETKQILREKTAQLRERGAYKKVTSIHIKVRDYLNELALDSYQEEFTIKYFSLDFAFPEHKVGIECQGAFFHIDPRFYPDGPICAIQRRNAGRDSAKKKFLCDMNGWNIIEIWEKEINDGSFKDILLEKLIEFGICSHKK